MGLEVRNGRYLCNLPWSNFEFFYYSCLTVYIAVTFLIYQNLDTLFLDILCE